MRLGTKIGTAFLGLSLLVGVGATASTVSAQGRYDRYGQDRYNQGRYGRGYGDDIRRIAEQKGFEDGNYEGTNRARARKSFDPYNTNSYRKAIDGYDRRMGDKNYYQQIYRQAYLRAYEQGYRQFGGRGYRRP